MTPEQLLLSALSAVVGALVYLYKDIKSRSMDCEKWRSEKEPIISEMAERLGMAEGATKIINACHIRNCPFAGKLDSSFSVAKNQETKTLKKPKP